MAQLTDLGLYSIPQWAVIYIEYGVDDTLSDEECEMISEFLLNFSKEGYFNLCFDYAAESDFNHRPEFGLPCECYETRIHASAKQCG